MRRGPLRGQREMRSEIFTRPSGQMVHPPEWLRSCCGSIRVERRSQTRNGRSAGMAHILVTGAAGFIGAKVSEQLLGRGDTVLGLDTMNDAYDVRLKQWRL